MRPDFFCVGRLEKDDAFKDAVTISVVEKFKTEKIFRGGGILKQQFQKNYFIAFFQYKMHLLFKTMMVI